MEYKNLHLLILALAVIHVQAAPERTTETKDLAAEIDELIDDGVTQMTNMMMNTPIMQNISHIVRQIFTEISKNYPKNILIAIQNRVKSMFEDQAGIMKNVLKFITDLFLVMSSIMPNMTPNIIPMMREISSIMGLLGGSGTNSNGGGTGGNDGISRPGR
ncbi:uncharacterized protein LOC105835060 [Monomorium pharaonis]|uniref:uncharacterized protein LOC105835060 n=1 Tax=Monomorium pharaonis TaxID=307658 RepID=UPI00063EE841|nr:uncharacterized protein LOC105835060 [Monomorium pharaonis]